MRGSGTWCGVRILPGPADRHTLGSGPIAARPRRAADTRATLRDGMLLPPSRRWYVRRTISIAALLVAAGGTQARAQFQPTEASRWSVQPFAGVLLDAYDVGDDGSRAGPMAGLQVARRISPSAHLAGSLAYARVSDVGPHPPSNEAHLIHRNEWVVASLGPMVELPVRRAAVSLSLQGGFAWRRTLAAGFGGEPPDPRINSIPSPWLQPGSDDFSVTGVLVPGAAVRVPMGSRLAVVGGASAYWTSFDEGGHVSPAFTLGLSWAP